jgi:SnoaL-like domain
MTETRAWAKRWREVWARGWRTGEADEIVALYAEGAYFQSHPFRQAVEPADYIVPTLAEEESAACEFGEPIVDGNLAAVEWSAETRLRDGGTEKLAGVSLLRFDPDGLVVEQRDFWAMA